MALGLSGAFAAAADLNAQESRGQGQDVEGAGPDGVLASDPTPDAPMGAQDSSLQAGLAQLLADLQGGGGYAAPDGGLVALADAAVGGGSATEALLDRYGDQTELFAMADIPRPVATVSAPTPVAAPAATWAVPTLLAPATSPSVSANEAVPASANATAASATGAGAGASSMSSLLMVAGGLGVAAAGGGAGGSASSTVTKDTIAPTVSAVAISSATGAVNSTLNAGDVVTVTVTMSEATTVTGTPTIGLLVGSTTVSAAYSSGSGTSALTFTYTIVSGQTDTNGISVVANTLSGTLADAAGNTATLTHNAVSDNASYLVDTTAPTVSAVAISSATGAVNSTLNAGDVVTVTVTMSEATTVTGTPTIGLLVGSTTVSAAYSSGSGTSALTFTYTIVSGQTDTNGISVVANTLSGTLADAAGNTATLTHNAVSDNASYLVDTTAPVIQSVVASSSAGTVTLTYDGSLDASHLPVTTSFTVTTGGVANAVTAVSVSGSVMTLTLTNTGFSGSVMVQYTDPSTGDDTLATQDAAGNDVLGFASGVIADGYIRGATVYIDTNGNGVADSGDYQTTTDSNGNFLIPSGITGTIIATGGVNIDTGVVNTMTLKAPSGSTTINPLTTLVQAVVSATGVSAAAAATSVASSLGLTLTSGQSLLSYDPISAYTVAVANGASTTAALAAQKSAAQIATIVSLANTDTSGAGTTFVANLATQVSAAASVNLASSATLTTLLGSAVTSITAISSASTAISVATTVSAVSVAQASVLDTVAPATPTVAVSALTNDNTPTATVTFNTTATDGTAVVAGDTLTFKAGSTTVASATLTSADITLGYKALTASTLGDGSYSVTAVIADQAGNSVTSALSAVTVDTTAPTLTVSGVVLSADTGTSATDLTTQTAAQTISATLSAALSTGDILYGSVDGGSTWTTITSMASGTAISWTGATLSGSNSIVFKVTDLAGNTGSSTGSTAYVLDTTAPTLTVSGVVLSADTGTSATDLTTQTAAQTISATLSAALSTGDILYGSVDGGSTWTTITSMASGTAISWTGATLSGSNSIVFKVTDLAGNTGSSIGSTSYVVDTTAPTVSAVAISTATGAVNSTLNAGDVVTVTVTMSEATVVVTGSSITPTIDLYIGSELVNAAYTGGTGTTALTFTYTIVAGQTDTDGISISANSLEKFTSTFSDTAGNTADLSHSAVSANSNYLVDTTAPTLTVSGVVLSADTGTSATDLTTQTAAQTISATLSAALSTGDILYGSVDGGSTWTTITSMASGTAISWTGATLSGSNSIVFKVTDLAGNTGSSTGSTVYVLDTTAPTTTVSGITMSADTGALASDLTTYTASQTISATLSAALDSGDILYGSVNNGSTWTNITSKVSDTAISWDSVTLAASSSIVFKLVDAAGNANTNVGSHSYVLDTAAPILVSATAANGGTAIALTYDSALDATNAPVASDFSVTMDGVANTVSSVSVSGAVVTLTMEDAVSGTVLTSYTDPNTADDALAIQDAAGNDAASLSGYSTLVTTITTPTLVLGTGVSGGATSAEATQVGGVVTVSADSGTTIAVSFTDTAGTEVIETVTGTGSAQAVVIKSSDLSSLTDGAISVSALATSAAGVVSDTSNVLSFTLDTQVPSAPTIALASASDTGTAADDSITNAVSITLNAELGSTSVLTFSANAHTVTKTVTGTGEDQTVSLSSANLATLGDGTITVSAVATDAAGNASDAASTSLTLDTTAPSMPTLALGTGVSGGATSAEATQDGGVVTVTAELDATTVLTFTNSVAGTSLVLSVAGTGEALAVTLSTENLATLGDGTITVSAVATDTAGNASSAGSSSFILDTSTPAAPSSAPTVTTAVAAGVSAAEGTAGFAVTVSLTGTGAAAGDTVNLLLGDALSQSHMLISADISAGSYAFTVNTDSLTSGDTSYSFTANVTDAAGNASDASSALSLSYDTAAPSAGTLSVADSVTGGISTAEGAAGIALTFTVGDGAVAGDSVALLIGAHPAYTHTLDSTDIAGGSYAFTVYGSALTANAANAFTAVVTDAAGNVGATSDPLSLTYDTTAPLAGTLSVESSVSSGLTYDEATSGFTLTFTLPTAAAAGDTVSLVIGGTAQDGYVLTGDDISAGSHAFSVDATYLTANANNSLTATVTDAAGNVGATSTGLSVYYDTIAPTVAATPSFDATTGLYTFTFTFSEAVTGFAVDGVTVSGGTASSFAATSTTVYTLVVTPSESTSPTDLSVDVAGGVATDAAGNDNTAATQVLYSVLYGTSADETFTLDSSKNYVWLDGGSDTLALTADTDSTAALTDVVYGFGANTVIDLSAILHTTHAYTSTTTNAAATLAANKLKIVADSGSLGTPTNNQLHFLASYDGTVASGGTDTTHLQLQYDTNATTASTTLSAIIAIDFHGDVTANLTSASFTYI
ncbi:MAG: Ig-like domain-containing protein [Betaproteobacteria bacterium]